MVLQGYFLNTLSLKELWFLEVLGVGALEIEPTAGVRIASIRTPIARLTLADEFVVLRADSLLYLIRVKHVNALFN